MGAKRPKSLVKLNLEPWLSLEEEICLPPKLSPPPASAVHAYPYTPPKPENRIITINYTGLPNNETSRDECTEFKLSVSLYLYFPATVNLVLFCLVINKP